MTIRNTGVGPSIDEFAEAFAGRSIYSVGDLYSGYDQFQLAVESRDITTMRTPLGLVRMCTLPQGGTNSVAHMVNAMNRVLRDCIPEITMPLLDDIPIKGCPEDPKDESIDAEGCRKFVADHIADCEKILQRLEGARLTFSGEKSAFGQLEILVVAHLCGSYGRKPSPAKVETITGQGRVWIRHRGPVILRSMRLLPHMDPSLRAHRRATLRPAEEVPKVRMD